MSSYYDLRPLIINWVKKPRQEFEALKFLSRCLQLKVHSSSLIECMFILVSFTIISYCSDFVVQQFNYLSYLSPFFYL